MIIPGNLNTSSQHLSAHSRNLNISSWISIGLSGALVITLGEWLTLLLPLNYPFLGIIAISSSLVGMSSHLSEATKKPYYNLWTHLKNFILKRKLAASGLGLGIIMLNPIFALASFALASLMQRIFPGVFNACDNILNRSLGYWQEKTFSQHIQYLKQQSIDYLRANPAKSISFLIGSTLGLTLFWYSLPVLSVATQGVYQFNFYFLDAIAQGLVATFSGGTIPYLLIQGVAHTLDEVMMVSLAASFSLAGGWGVDQTRLFALRQLEALKANIQPKYLAARDYLSLQQQRLQRITGKIKQIPRKIKEISQNVYQKSLQAAKFLVSPKQWIAALRRQPTHPSTQSEYLAYLHNESPQQSKLAEGILMADSATLSPVMSASPSLTAGQEATALISFSSVDSPMISPSVEHQFPTHQELSTDGSFNVETAAKLCTPGVPAIQPIDCGMQSHWNAVSEVIFELPSPSQADIDLTSPASQETAHDHLMLTFVTPEMTGLLTKKVAPMQQLAPKLKTFSPANQVCAPAIAAPLLLDVLKNPCSAEFSLLTNGDRLKANETIGVSSAVEKKGHQSPRRPISRSQSLRKQKRC